MCLRELFLLYLLAQHTQFDFENNLTPLQINYSVRSRHYLYGSHLHKAQDALETDICGSICVETTCQNKCTIDTPQSDSSKRLVSNSVYLDIYGFQIYHGVF